MPMCLTQRGPTTTVFVCHWARVPNSPGHDFVDKRTAGTPAPTPVGQTGVSNYNIPSWHARSYACGSDRCTYSYRTDGCSDTIGSDGFSHFSITVSFICRAELRAALGVHLRQG
jgi:hypothetical protein